MKIISHRGSPKNCHENTIEAFKNAIELGVDGIETDVRLTADDELVLFHDHRIDNVKISLLTYRELKQKAQYDVTKLKHLLQEIKEPILFNLEIKSRSALSPFLHLISKFQKDYLISSSWHVVIKQIRHFNIPCGPIVSCAPDEWFLNHGENIIWNWEFFDPEFLSSFPEKKHFIYGVEKTDSLEYEVEGIITDYPEFYLDSN